MFTWKHLWWRGKKKLSLSCHNWFMSTKWYSLLMWLQWVFCKLLLVCQAETSIVSCWMSNHWALQQLPAWLLAHCWQLLIHWHCVPMLGLGLTWSPAQLRWGCGSRTLYIGEQQQQNKFIVWCIMYVWLS